jgi:hypothetical protein
MDQSAEKYDYQQLASMPRPKQEAANCGLGNGANIALFMTRPRVFFSVLLAANRTNRGASPRDFRQEAQSQKAPAKDLTQRFDSGPSLALQTLIRKRASTNIYSKFPCSRRAHRARTLREPRVAAWYLPANICPTIRLTSTYALQKLLSRSVPRSRSVCSCGRSSDSSQGRHGLGRISICRRNSLTSASISGGLVK